MKTSLVARGITGIVASLLGVAAVGCSADVADGVAGDGAEVGSTSQALGSGLTVGTGAAADLEFSGSIKLASNILNANGVANALELVVGGVNLAATVTGLIQVYDHDTNTLSLLTSLPNSDVVVEPSIALVPDTNGLVYLIAGGRTARDGTVTSKSWVLTLTLTANKITGSTIAEVTGAAMPSAHVFSHKSIKQCATAANKELIAFGGPNAAGSFQSLAAPNGVPSGTRDILVFKYIAGMAGDGAASQWRTLKDQSTPAKTVRLRVERGYPEVLSLSDTVFHVAGGMNSGALAVDSVDRVTVASVNGACVAANNETDADGNDRMAKAGNPMPGALARFSSIQLAPFGITGGDADYDFIVAGGNDAASYGAPNAGLPVDTYAFDPASDVWSSINTLTSTAIQEGRVFPRLVADNASGAGGLPTVVKLVTGIMPEAGNEDTNLYYNTSLVVDRFQSATPGWDNNGGNTLGANQDRVGVFADLLFDGVNTETVLGLGSTHIAQTGVISTPDSMQSDVVFAF
jgi:hypothetical protein